MAIAWPPELCMSCGEKFYPRERYQHVCGLCKQAREALPRMPRLMNPEFLSRRHMRPQRMGR